MKKTLLILSFCIGILFPVYAEEIEILPTFQSKSYVQDRVWTGTFQIVWNDFVNKIIHNPVKFPEGTPESVKELNKQSFDITQLSKKCYYKYVGKINKNTKQKISSAIKRKFKESSQILDKVDWTTGKNRYIVYAMLKKDFQFTNPLDKLGVDIFRDSQAEYFGINANSSEDLNETVEVLFFNDETDFAVKLNTNTGDELYLYKTATTKPFNFIYSDMFKKSKLYEGSKIFEHNDEIMIPNVKFIEEKSFDELLNNRIKGTNIVIDQAIESIDFNMDNTGVKLVSEAVLTAVTTSLRPEEEPRIFNFNDTFVLFIKEQAKQKPYFALRVHNIDKFQ